MGSALVAYASILLGLLSWVIPVIHMIKNRKLSFKSKIILPFASMSACAVSMYLQIISRPEIINSDELIAFLDTQAIPAFASSVLLFFTFVLNVLAIFSSIESEN